MMTLDEVRRALADRRLDRVAEATGLHPNTIWAIRVGRNRNPSYATMEALSDYLTAATEHE